MKLTDIKCKSAKPSVKPLKMADGGGMYLEIMPNGSKYWRLKYRIKVDGVLKEKRLALGVYPEISLKDARDRRDEAKRLLEHGKDPSLEKQKKKALSHEKNVNTFKAIALEWHENRKDRWSERYADGVLTRLENDIFPEIGNYPITDIEPPILLQAIRKIEKRKAQELARRQLQKCGEIFRYAIACGKAVRDPSADIKEALRPQEKGHFAALDVKELPQFLKAIERNDARLYQNTRNALTLMMLTFVRTSELIGARWEEIDFEAREWTIPAERMKMKKEHVVPLSRQSIAILENQKEIAGGWPLVFPSSVRPQQSISNNTILGAIKRLGYMGRMTGHGFRALAMSAIKQELGYRHEVVDRQLAHAPRNKIDKAYDRAYFLKDRTVMMQEWADYIDDLGQHGEVIKGNFEKKSA
jgi:integrase